MIAVISDVHSNLAALRAVLRDVERRKARDIVFLGDAVGYGPEPNECIGLIEERSGACIAGNHDWAVLGLTDITYFNAIAKAAIRWTDEALTPESRKILSRWPLVKTLREQGALLVHGSPESPEEWHYLVAPEGIKRAFGFFRERLCLVGHSHSPFIAEMGAASKMQFHGGKAALKEGSRYVINVGSVGQPRDGDPRACYALLGEDDVELVRVEYPVEETQHRMAAAGLPEPLILRLSLGR